MVKPFLRFIHLFVGCATLIIAGCAGGSHSRLKALSKVGQEQDFHKGYQIVKSGKKLYGKNNELLFWLDQGVLLHYSGNYDSSNIALEKAYQVFDNLYAKSVSKQAASLLVNDNTIPYRGKPYEILFLFQLKAFNFLALENYDAALVEIRRAQLYLQSIKEKQDPIEWAEAEGMFHFIAALIYGASGENDNANISLYKSVKSYQSTPGKVPLEIQSLAMQEFTQSGRTEDIQSLGLTEASPSREVPEVKDSEIVLIGYAGKAPVLDEKVFWGTWVADGLLVFHYRNPETGEVITETVPAPSIPASEYEKAGKGEKTRSGTTLHIKFALPAVKSRNFQTRQFRVKINNQPGSLKTFELASTKPLLKNYLEFNRGKILAKTVARVVLRTYTSQKTKNQLAGSNPLANILMSVGTDILADQLEKADIRIWFLLPFSIECKRIKVEPGTHRLQVEALGAGGNIIDTKMFDEITVKPGEKRFVFYPVLK